MATTRTFPRTLVVTAGALALALTAALAGPAAADPGDPLPPPAPGTVIGAMSPALQRSLVVARADFLHGAREARATVTPALTAVRGRILLEVTPELNAARNAHVAYDQALQQGADAATIGMLKSVFDGAASSYRTALASAQARHAKQVSAAAARLRTQMRGVRADYSRSVTVAFARHAPGTKVPAVLLAAPRLQPGPNGWATAFVGDPAGVGPADSGPGATP